MATIGIWVSDDIKEKWDAINKHDRIAYKELRAAVLDILTKHADLVNTPEEVSLIEEILSSIRREDVLADTR